MMVLRVAWPDVLIKHGVRKRTPDPVAAVRVVSMKVGAAADVSGSLLVGVDISQGGAVGFSVPQRSFSDMDELVFFMTLLQPCIKLSLRAC